jgi:hypothetical protein
MSGFPILDLVIGIIFIYFLLSIICSSAVELWCSLRSSRARLLEQWLKRIFNSPALDSHGIPKLQRGKPVSVGQEIMDHCMVTVLSKTGKSTSYIDAGNFVSALLDKITLDKAEPVTNDKAEPGTNTLKFPVKLPPKDLGEYIKKIEKSTLISGELKRTILSFAYQAEAASDAIKNIPAVEHVTTNITTTIKSGMDQFRERLENWYDTNSNRLTGTFKRKTVMPRTFILATIITITLNVDTIEISKYLYKNKEASKQLAEKAMNTYENYKDRIDELKKTDTTIKGKESADMNVLNKNTMQLKNDIDSLQALNLPIGWENARYNSGTSFWDYFFNWRHIGGWLATIMAICMGAPFWFDILNKIANLRGVGPKPVVADDSNKK